VIGPAAASARAKRGDVAFEKEPEMKSFRTGFFAAAVALAACVSPALALDKISIVVFGPPSLGALLQPIIKSRGLDRANDLDIDFQERTPDAYAAQFNSGEFQVGGSAALLTVGLADVRGVKVSYLFNLFDFWGGVVTSRPDVKTLKDLEGKDLAAARGTTNYLMFDWFARQQGLDLSKVAVVNTATPGLVGYALADRAAAVQLWEPAYTTLLARKPDLRTLDLQIAQRWRAFAGSPALPYLGLAAHQSWIDKNRPLVPKLYAAYKAAAEWLVANPEEAAKIIAPKGSAADQKAIADLVKANDRLGLDIKWAADLRKEIGFVYAAGRSTGFLPSDPAASTIYEAK
jgi:NitT/TauT family transport system substrate-binding protein